MHDVADVVHVVIDFVHVVIDFAHVVIDVVQHVSKVVHDASHVVHEVADVVRASIGYAGASIGYARVPIGVAEGANGVARVPVGVVCVSTGYRFAPVGVVVVLNGVVGDADGDELAPVGYFHAPDGGARVVEDASMARMRNKEALQVAFMRLRDSTGMNQLQWGAYLGVSKQTISRWEGALRLPTKHQAVGIIEQLRKDPNLDPDLVEHLAEKLGLEPLDEVDDADAPTAAPQLPSPLDARAIVDGALLGAAEELDLSPRVVRRAFTALLDALVVSGVAPKDARAALTPQPKQAAT